MAEGTGRAGRRRRGGSGPRVMVLRPGVTVVMGQVYRSEFWFLGGHFLARAPSQRLAQLLP